jgi:thymidylate synthase (FAD)
MKIIQAKAIIYDSLDYQRILQKLERAGRGCYNSVSQGDSEKFVKKLIDRNEVTFLEHVKVSTTIQCSRATHLEMMTHRHRTASSSSQRWIKYTDKKGDRKELTFICPTWINFKLFEEGNTATLFPEAILWVDHCKQCEKAYLDLLSLGKSPQEAREVLPNSTAVDKMWSMNLSAWRYFFEIRTSISRKGKPSPEMTYLANNLLTEFYQKLPVIFEDLYFEMVDQRKKDCLEGLPTSNNIVYTKS